MDVSKLAMSPREIPLKSPAGPADLKETSGTGSATAGEKAKLQKACKDFETIFLNYILSKMRESVPQSDLMGSGQGEKIYRGMMDEELAKQMAASGGIGLAKMLYQQFDKGAPKPAHETPPDGGETRVETK